MIDFQDIMVLDKINENVGIIEYSAVSNNSDLLSYNVSYKVKNPVKPQIVAPDTTEISPSLQSLKKNLLSKNVTEQRDALKTISGCLSDKNIAPQFLDKSLTDTLFAVANEDISNFKGSTFSRKRLIKKYYSGKDLTPEQIKEVYTLSERGTAEANKRRAIVLIAKIQNVLYSELSERSDLKPSFYDMPAVDGLLNLLNNSSDIFIQKAVMDAFLLMDRPEFSKEIKEILSKNEKILKKFIKNCENFRYNILYI